MYNQYIEDNLPCEKGYHSESVKATVCGYNLSFCAVTKKKKGSRLNKKNNKKETKLFLLP